MAAESSLDILRIERMNSKENIKGKIETEKAGEKILEYLKKHNQIRRNEWPNLILSKKWKSQKED